MAERHILKEGYELLENGETIRYRVWSDGATSVVVSQGEEKPPELFLSKAARNALYVHINNALRDEGVAAMCAAAQQAKKPGSKP